MRTCTLAVFLLAGLFLVNTPLYAQDFSFADECVSTVNNQTVVFRQDLDRGFGNSRQVQPGDTVAVYTNNGTCAGYNVWTGDSDMQISAAADVALTNPIDGYVGGESLKVKVFDRSEDAIVDIGTNVSFESCSSSPFPFCVEDGSYQTDTIVFIDGLNTGPLPVEFVGFRAERSGSSVQLIWDVASETNNAGFEVQLRRPDAPGWTRLTFVQGAGTTTKPTSYRYETDELKYGTHAFRIRQVDQSGSSLLSDSVKVEIPLNRSYDISSTYPNPAVSSTSLDVAVGKRQNVKVELYDVLGRRLETVFDQLMTPNRTEVVRVKTDGLASGSYFLRIRGESFATTRRLTVVQ